MSELLKGYRRDLFVCCGESGLGVTVFGAMRLYCLACCGGGNPLVVFGEP